MQEPGGTSTFSVMRDSKLDREQFNLWWDV